MPVRNPNVMLHTNYTPHPAGRSCVNPWSKYGTRPQTAYTCYSAGSWYCRQGWCDIVVSATSRSGRFAVKVYRWQQRLYVYYPGNRSSNATYRFNRPIDAEYSQRDINLTSWQSLVERLGFDVEIVHWPRIRNGWFACPYWVAAVSLIAAAVSPWVSTRFSVRTLLIATTLIAVVLGLAVWAMK